MFRHALTTSRYSDKAPLSIPRIAGHAREPDAVIASVLKSTARTIGNRSLYAPSIGIRCCWEAQIEPPSACACITGKGEERHENSYTAAFAMLTGATIGAFAVQGLRAQTKPPAYIVTEIEITNLDAYEKEYVPLAQASIKAAGGHLLAAGQNIVVFEGAPPKTRVAINRFDSMEAIQNWRNSAQYKEDRKVGDKYAKFRSFAVEGLPQ